MSARISVLCLVLFTGCADAFSAARVGLATVGRVQLETLATWKAYDRQHQIDLIENAKTEAEGKLALAEHRLKVQAPAVKSLQALYLASVGTQKTVDLAELGKQKLDLRAIVGALFDVLEKTKKTLMDLGVPLGGM